MTEKETPWHNFTEHGFNYRIKAQYGLAEAYPHSQKVFWVKPIFEIQTANGYWRQDGGIDATRYIRDYVPEIAPYMKWRQVGPKGPLFYLENARLWFRGVQGKERILRRGEDAIGKFMESIRIGAFPGDQVPREIMREFGVAQRLAKRRRGPKEWSPDTKADLSWAHVQEWLEARLPDLVAAWTVDMGELGLLDAGEKPKMSGLEDVPLPPNIERPEMWTPQAVVQAVRDGFTFMIPFILGDSLFSPNAYWIAGTQASATGLTVGPEHTPEISLIEPDDWIRAKVWFRPEMVPERAWVGRPNKHGVVAVYLEIDPETIDWDLLNRGHQIRVRG